MKGQVMQSISKSNVGDEVYSTRMGIEIYEEEKDVHESGRGGDKE